MTKFMVLLVENDLLQRAIMADLFKAEGIEVLECSTGEAAELVIARSGAELQALITDQNLEGVMTGAELARFALEQFSSLCVTVISGNEAPLLPDGATFLRKPVDFDQLLSTIRK